METVINGVIVLCMFYQQGLIEHTYIQDQKMSSSGQRVHGTPVRVRENNLDALTRKNDEELKEQKRKDKEIKAFKEDEKRKKQLEYIKMKEWEEKFDREQKAKEHRENLREQRLRQKELERLKSFESNEKQIDQNLTSGLQNFDIDKTSEN